MMIKNKKGLSALEIALILAVAAIVAVVLFLAFRRSIEEDKIRRAKEEVNAIAADFMRLLKEQEQAGKEAASSGAQGSPGSSAPDRPSNEKKSKKQKEYEKGENRTE